jgi:hypothetical protein
MAFAYDFVTRSGSVPYERLKELSPRFVAAYDAYVASRAAPLGSGTSPR